MNDKVWPVFVASRGRPEGKTFKLLNQSQIFYYVFVEPQEAQEYQAFHGADKVLVLPLAGQGIGYVRQLILKFAREMGHEWYWMMDDDINGFFKTVSRKTERITAIEAMMAAQDHLQKLPTVAQAALEYQQFAWSATKPLRWNSYCDVCVAINTNRTKGINYRPELRLKEDRDFTLQIVANSGYQTVRLSFYSFDVPKNGTNKGGCQDDYKTNGKELEHSKKMVEMWPGVCSLNIKKDGRPDVKINWKLFSPNA